MIFLVFRDAPGRHRFVFHLQCSKTRVGGGLGGWWQRNSAELNSIRKVKNKGIKTAEGTYMAIHYISFLGGIKNIKIFSFIYKFCTVTSIYCNHYNDFCVYMGN